MILHISLNSKHGVWKPIGFKNPVFAVLICLFLFFLVYFISLSVSAHTCVSCYPITITPCTMSCVAVWRKKTEQWEKSLKCQQLSRNVNRRLWRGNECLGKNSHSDYLNLSLHFQMLLHISPFTSPPDPHPLLRITTAKGRLETCFWFCFFAVKGLANILCFVGHVICVTTAHLCHSGMKAAMDNILQHECRCVLKTNTETKPPN